MPARQNLPSYLVVCETVTARNGLAVLFPRHLCAYAVHLYGTQGLRPLLGWAGAVVACSVRLWRAVVRRRCVTALAARLAPSSMSLGVGGFLQSRQAYSRLATKDTNNGDKG